MKSVKHTGLVFFGHSPDLFVFAETMQPAVLCHQGNDCIYCTHPSMRRIISDGLKYREQRSDDTLQSSNFIIILRGILNEIYVHFRGRS